jgi:hypothetical protein
MNIVQGNLFKPLKIQLFKGGKPFALLNSDELVLRWSFGAPTLSSDITEVIPMIINAATGELSYNFELGQTDLIGSYYGQVTITRAGKSLSFPDDGSYFRWRIRPKI